MSTDTPAQPLRTAAQAVLDRWDSPKWEWQSHGPTADLMADLRNALAASPQPTAAQPVGKRLTHEEAARTDGRSGPFIWWGDVEPGAYLYASAAPTQAVADHVPVSAEESAAIDAKLGLVLLPPIRVPERTHAMLERIAEQRGLVIQAVVRELLEPSETTGAPVAELVEAVKDAAEYLRDCCNSPDKAAMLLAALSRAPGAGMPNVRAKQEPTA